MSENDIVVNLDIKGDDKLKTAFADVGKSAETHFNKTEEATKRSKNAFSDLGSEIKNNFTNVVRSAVVAYAGFEVINKTIATLKMGRAEFQENALAQNRLRFAIGYTSFALQEQAKIIGNKLKIDDTEVTLAQAKISAYIKTEAQIKSILPAIMDLGSYLGSNEAAAQMLGRAFADDAAELGRLKIKVDGAAGSQERLESIIKGVNKGMGGQALAAAEVKDIWDALALTWKDVNESLWGIFAKTNNVATMTSEAMKESILVAKESLKNTFGPAREALERDVSEMEKRLTEIQATENDKRSKSSLGAAMERQKVERALLDEEAKKNKETNDKIIQSEQKKIDAINKAMFALADAKEKFKLDGEKNTKELVDNSEQKAQQDNADWLNNLMEGTANNERLLLDRNLAYKKQISLEETQMAAFATANQLGLLASLFQGHKQYLGLYKTLAIAQATMDTYASAIAAYKSAVAVPIVGPVLGPVAAGTAIALGLANIAQISTSKFAGGTNYAPGGMALVGEQGPEMMYVPRGAQIKTASETRNIVNNSGSTVTVNVLGSNGRVVETLRASLRSGSGTSFVRDLKDALAVA